MKFLQALGVTNGGQTLTFVGISESKCVALGVQAPNNQGKSDQAVLLWHTKQVLVNDSDAKVD
jgi:hypothetical protein